LNITLTQPTALTGIINISVQENDYLPKISAKLKELSRKAVIPGFRPGKVPVGVVKKMYGKSLLTEEIDLLLRDSLGDYIKEKNLPIVGEPIPNYNKTDTIDWETQKDFDFEFEIGLVNDFAFDFPSAPFSEHVILVTDEMIEEKTLRLKLAHASIDAGEISNADTVLVGNIEPEGGGEKKNSVGLLGMLGEEEVKPFLDLKAGQSIAIDVDQLPENKAFRASLLSVPEKDVKEAKGKFTFTVESLLERKLPEFNEQFFSKALGDPEIKTEEDFRAKIKEILIAESKKEADYWLAQHIEDYCVNHTDIPIPEDFLRKWFKLQNKNLTEEALEERFPFFIRSAKWTLITSKIAKENNLVIDTNEVVERTRQQIIRRAGVSPETVFESISKEELSSYAINYLMGKDQRGERFAQIYQAMLGEKAINLIKEKITLDKKEVTLEEYTKMVKAEYTPLRLGEESLLD